MEKKGATAAPRIENGNSEVNYFQPLFNHVCLFLHWILYLNWHVVTYSDTFTHSCQVKGLSPLPSAEMLLSVSAREVKETAWQSSPACWNVCFSKTCSKERGTALGCLQAVITAPQRLTQTQYPGQAAQKREPWMLRYSVLWWANCCRCRSHPQFIFHKDVSSNYVASPHTDAESSWRSFWNVLPRLSWNIQTTHAQLIKSEKPLEEI